ncbi:Nramp family divalent metal transporter [[Clostridium] symbiosum]|uniref:Nramp family divalent metal transporter n=1 Tax=Clostridium symbiosum TaxID=1512 RepID=UPI001D086CC2|nr:Nramp family divalent metal transporter [[Clostridium] symbiosum]MCB6607864.1 Nramp family divalent metal transporter [[Clostridium] symbiosum]MCB6930365.1 Nramp family divalent metal transporter [[Clostridium] symbiosum]
METKKTYTFKEKCKALGPGILVVGSFIGPGTITSATKAGATYGYSLLWTVIFSVIAVIVMQEMAARLGIVTQNGLAEELVKELSDRPPLKWAMVALVAAAIGLGGVAYMGGDLTGTAIGISSLTGIPSHIVAPLWGVGVLILTSTGDAVKSLEKLLSVCVSVMAIVFIITMIIVKPDLGELIKGAVPNVPQNAIMTCVAMIGTTVVPYNMFIHATSARKTWHDPEELPLARFDVTVSMIIGGLITGAVLITAGTVMRGMSVSSAADMAYQLEPLLGSFAKPFLSIGLIAAGVSSAVVTPLGVSYVFAGLFHWGMDKKDKRFFATNIIVVVIGIIVSATGYNPISIIMMAQAVNGIFLPIIVIALVFITSRARAMGQYKNSMVRNLLGGCVAIISLIIGVSSVMSLF